MIFKCNKCGEYKPISDFPVETSRPRGIKYTCKECYYRIRRDKFASLSEEDKEIIRERNRKTPSRIDAHKKCRYGVTQEMYLQMKADQDGKCAICFREVYYNLNIDHNHMNDKVRGLLCASCNRLLGLVCESPEILERAAEYLREDGFRAN